VCFGFGRAEVLRIALGFLFVLALLLLLPRQEGIDTSMINKKPVHLFLANRASMVW
jgi:hypothetical protein